MRVKYLRGYDPEEFLDIVCIRPAIWFKTLDGTIFMQLVQRDGPALDATSLVEEDGMLVARLPENW